MTDQNEFHGSIDHYSPAERLKNMTDQIRNQVLSWHDYFNTQLWKEPFSYHNSEHILATLKANDSYVTNSSDTNDPLKLRSDLARWNQNRRKYQDPDDIDPDNNFEELNKDITFQELSNILDIAWLTHDIGNIIKTFVKNPDGIKPVFLDQYMSVDGEPRSLEVALQILLESDLPDTQKFRFAPLLQHLISNTTFIPKKGSENSPFGKYMRVIDQIGSNLHTEDKNSVEGLLYEKYRENPDETFNPDFFFNFVLRRFPQLVPVEEDRSSLYTIWDKKPPAEIAADTAPMPIRTFIFRNRTESDQKQVA